MVAEPIYSPTAIRIQRRTSNPFAQSLPDRCTQIPHPDYMIAMPLTAVATTSLLTLAAATSGMFTGNEEWSVIITSALGGAFGSVIGVSFAIFAKPSEWKWHIFGLRWFINVCASVIFGPLAYWYLFPIYFKTDSPSPILALACGGAVGALGILLLQPFVPWLQRFFQKRLDKFTNTKS